MSLKCYNGKREEIRFGVYDLEWLPETFAVTLVGVRDERGYRDYRDVESFLVGELVKANSGKVFFAHAGGLADIQFVLEAFIKRADKRYRIKGHWSGSSLIICRISRGRDSWTFADSFWLFRDSLDKIGKSIGLHKGGSDYFCPNYPNCGHSKCIFYAPYPIIRDYNERDNEILYKAIERFQNEILELGGKMRMTIASNAMMLFRARFLRQTLPTSRTLNRIAREAYIASRVEVFGRYCDKANYYDVNSSFPHSMTFPLPGFYLGTSSKYVEGESALIDATVSNPDDYLPAIPIRLGDGRIYFPTGKFRRLMTSEDFCFLLDRGGIVHEVHEVHRFESFTDLADYVDIVYALRKNCDDEFRRLVYKYLLNALYGKFGEDEEKSELSIYPQKRPTCQKGCKEGECGCIDVYAPGIYRVNKQVVIPHAHVPIAAAITSRSRALLSNSLATAMGQGRIYYADTDSVVTTSLMPTSPNLGDLKDEGENDSLLSGTFLSPKLYKLRWQNHQLDKETGKCKRCSDASCGHCTSVRSKGFRKLNESEFDSLSEGKPAQIKRMIRIQENFGQGCFSPREDDFFKHALSHLSVSQVQALGFSPNRLVKPKRCLLDNGDTRPWRIEELLGPDLPKSETA